ncbi:MAG: cytochrome c peroxidase [bacterium]|nr:cytochrome c peroxidase [bacterium]
MKNYRWTARIVAFVLIFCTASAWGQSIDFHDYFKPLPTVAEEMEQLPNKAIVGLGKRLFLETAMSQNRDLSCSSCHDLARFGVDSLSTSIGHKGQRGTRNAPSVYNASFHIAQFWDGRASNLEEQALQPILNPREMAMSDEQEVLFRLTSPEVLQGRYPSLFVKAFPDESAPLTFANIGRAIGAFERTLLTPAPFDDFLRGTHDALSPTQLGGLEKFVDLGCVACHAGRGVGGRMYQKLGMIVPYESSDMGRYEVTGLESDRQVFKVPSLRNVAMTAPYFHDGSISSLREAVRLMGHHQLGTELTTTEIDELVEFLGSLTGVPPVIETRLQGAILRVL